MRLGGVLGGAGARFLLGSYVVGAVRIANCRIVQFNCYNNSLHLDALDPYGPRDTKSAHSFPPVT